MTFLIAAAGTGGHVFPGLAVGEALVDLGVERNDILYVGGDRLEHVVYPEAGFPFLGLELRGLARSLDIKNLALPGLMWRATQRIQDAIRRLEVSVAMGMGGYVTVPAAIAARRSHINLMIAEQNAEAGLANRLASRWAKRCFVSFPDTAGLADGEWVGNPVRGSLARFDRLALRPAALGEYGLRPEIPTLGVLGGSLGAGLINDTITAMVASWSGPPIQVVHLVGERHLGAIDSLSATEPVTWRRIGFETRMERFYAVSDLVVARAGGGVAELTATGTPSILVPGRFGSAGHQTANAEFLARTGAALVITESRLGDLGGVVEETLFDEERLETMRAAGRRIGKPDAARHLAQAMLEASR